MSNTNNSFNIKSFIATIESKDFSRKDDGYKAQFFAVKSDMLAKWHIYMAHRDRRMRETLCEALHDTKIAEIIVKVVNEGQESGHGFDKKFAYVLRDVVETQRRIYRDKDDKILACYEEVIAKILRKDIKHMVKYAGIDKELAYELLSIVPTPDMITPTTLRVFVHKVCRRLYEGSEHGFDIKRIKTARKVLSFLFINEVEDEETTDTPLITMNDIALAVLLERRNPEEAVTKRVYSLLTVFALDEIESNGKKTVKQLMIDYAGIRAKEKEGHRRIDIAASSSADYPKIMKVVNKLKKKEKYVKSFR